MKMFYSSFLFYPFHDDNDDMIIDPCHSIVQADKERKTGKV